MEGEVVIFVLVKLFFWFFHSFQMSLLSQASYAQMHTLVNQFSSEWLFELEKERDKKFKMNK